MSLINLSRSLILMVFFVGIVDAMLPDHLPFGNQKRFWGDFERGPQGVIFRSQIGGVIVRL